MREYCQMSVGFVRTFWKVLGTPVQVMAIGALILMGVACSPKVLPTGEVLYVSSTNNGIITLTSTGYYKGTAQRAIQEAERRAFEALLFRGIPGSQVASAMLGTDEQGIKSKNAKYFNEFFENRRCRNFITATEQLSSEREAGYMKATIRVSINYKALRKDLEDQGLKRGFGL